MAKKSKKKPAVNIQTKELHIHMDERMFSINHNHTFCGDAEVDMEEDFEATEELFKDEEERIGLALEISSRTGIDYTTVMRVLMEEENCLWDAQIDGKPCAGCTGKGDCYD